MKRIVLTTLALLAFTAAFAQKARLIRHERCKIEGIAPRPTTGAITGSQFMLRADTISFQQREQLIVDAILGGNVPDSLRFFRKIEFTTPVVDSIAVFQQPHTIALWVTHDYLAIGTNDDFVRMPMGPIAAQRIADALKCSLPTSFIVDRINDVSEGAIDIFPFRPLGDRNTRPIVFQDSNNAINALMKAHGYHYGQMISGLKKDIVLATRLWSAPRYLNRVAIYGWYRPDGSRVQSTYAGHGVNYVDYSHGVRLVSRRATIDGKECDVREILENPVTFRLLSDEAAPIVPASYINPGKQ